jgi:hypothetical protein
MLVVFRLSIYVISWFSTCEYSWCLRSISYWT